MSSEHPGPRLPAAGSRRIPCAGDANALRAIGLLSRWNRAARMQTMFAGPCACCVGDEQITHMERQVIDYLYERYRSNAALEALLRACKEGAAAERGAVGEMMRQIAMERSPANAGEHGRLLEDFDELVRSLE